MFLVSLSILTNSECALLVVSLFYPPGSVPKEFFSIKIGSNSSESMDSLINTVLIVVNMNLSMSSFSITTQLFFLTSYPFLICDQGTFLSFNGYYFLYLILCSQS
jgi:hypothetical protein